METYLHILDPEDLEKKFNHSVCIVHFENCTIPDISTLEQCSERIDLYFDNCAEVPIQQIIRLNIMGLRISDSYVIDSWSILTQGNFQTLSIQNLKIENFSFLSKMKQLDSLYLNDTNFTSLNDLPRDLEILDLSKCKLNNKLLSKDFPHLRHLTLKKTSCESLEFLYKMPNIKYLNLKGIDVSLPQEPVKSLQWEKLILPNGKCIDKNGNEISKKV